MMNIRNLDSKESVGVKFKGTVIQIQKALTNDRLRASEVVSCKFRNSNYL